MYSLPYFKEKNEQTVKDFIRQHPFALVIGRAATYPEATQIPLLIREAEGKLFFEGHVMRNSDHHKAFEQDPHVLCVFTSGHAYISASWYTNPLTASTWNYMSVHAKGVLEFLGQEDLLRILEETTKHFEENEHSPASYHHLPAEYVQKLSKAIIAFRIEVKDLNHIFKLSQNRDKKSYETIIKHLEAGDGAAKTIAEEMKLRKEHLFQNVDQEQA